MIAEVKNNTGKLKPWKYTAIGFTALVSLTLILNFILVKDCTPTQRIGDFIITLFICGGTWGGCVAINKFICSRISWDQHPIRRLIISYILVAIYSVFIIFVALKSYNLFFPEADIPLSSYIIYSVFSLLVTLLVTSIYAISDFIDQWKSSEIKAEQMKQQMLKSEYESLKNQVNPHFLFNSLNTLVALIPENPVKATDFVQKLSKVFRYSLQNSDNNTIELGKELEVVNAFLFLQKMRFGDSLQFHVGIETTDHHHQIISHGLLTLVENAAKHNEASIEKPLTITIDMDGKDYVVVKNSLQRKRMTQPSTGIGLPNIVNRYAVLSNKPVLINETNSEFEVKLPIIK